MMSKPSWSRVSTTLHQEHRRLRLGMRKKVLVVVGMEHAPQSSGHSPRLMDFKKHLGNPTQTQGLNVEWSSAEPGIELL